MRVVLLVDGEHYPTVVRWAVDELRARGDDVAAAVFCGGSEKVGPGDLAEAYGGVEVVRGREALGATIDRVKPDAVVDLSDEPVLTPQDRFRLASVTLNRGVTYRGSDFELRPPPLEPVLTKPSIRVIATGKRVGKTAIAGALARHAVERGRRPVIVAMGRGGPPHPEILEIDSDLTAAALVALADSGRHAASDHIEDAVTSRVTTIGCRRVGGGLAGSPYLSNVVEGARIAESREEDVVILEGSGSAVPPVAARAGLLCIPAPGGDAIARSYLGPLRLLLADVAVVTMAEQDPPAAATEAAIKETAPHLEVVRTVFRPQPLSSVDGLRVFFCSTAPHAASRVLREHLESAHGCDVVGMSHGLSDREALERELREAPDYDVLVTELKAAGVDVAARAALRRGVEVVFADNVLVPSGSPPDAVESMFDRLLELADRRTG